MIKFYRKGATIQDVENNTRKTFNSINSAKRESTLIQSKHGLGSLAVVDKLPPLENDNV